METNKTGAFIAQRRKALGLTQKELAERLLVSDKAVSRWETGVGYPEVTMLPLLAQTLDTTVDALLAGQSNADSASQSSGLRRAYAAEKLASADRRLLLACCVGSLAFVWYAVSLGMQGIFRLLLLCILFTACAVWHRSKWRQLHDYAAPDDLLISRRRAMLLSGIYTVIALLFGTACVATTVSKSLFLRRGRYKIVLEVHQFYGELLLWVLLLLLVWLGILAYCCLRMTAQTRFHPVMPGVVSAVPCLGAGLLLFLRISLIIRFSPSNYDHALITVESSLAPAMSQLLAGARIIWIAGTALLLLSCAVLRLTRRCCIPLPLLLSCAALQSLMWYVVGTGDRFLMLTFPSVLAEQTGMITVYATACFFVLICSLLLWGSCTLLSSLFPKTTLQAA